MLIEISYPQDIDGYIWEDWVLFETESGGQEAPCRIGGYENGHRHINTIAMKAFVESGLDYAEYDVPCQKEGCKEILHLKIRKHAEDHL